MQVQVFQGVMIPFLGTALGSACVLFMKNKLNHLLQRALTGFAARVMAVESPPRRLPKLQKNLAVGLAVINNGQKAGSEVQA